MNMRVGIGVKNAVGSLSPDELINPKSTLSSQKPIKKEASVVMAFSKDHEKWIKEWIRKRRL